MNKRQKKKQEKKRKEALRKIQEQLKVTCDDPNLTLKTGGSFFIPWRSEGEKKLVTALIEERVRNEQKTKKEEL